MKKTTRAVIVGTAAAAVLSCGLVASAAPRSASVTKSNKQTVFNPFTCKAQPPKQHGKKIVPMSCKPKPAHCHPRSPSKPKPHCKDVKPKKKH